MEDDMLKNSRLAVALATAGIAVSAALAGCSSSGGNGAGPSTVVTSGGHSAAAFPVTIDAANGSVTLDRQPSAIVSLSPTATEMLFAIGAGDQVKAVDKNSDYPAEAPKTDLDAYQLNAEAVAGYRPDLIISAGLTPAQMKQLTALHIPVLDEPAAQNLDGTYDQLAQLGQATGHEDEAAAEVTDLKAQIAQVTKTVAASGPHSYYYELDQTYYSVTSTGTFIGQVLATLGLHSIADAAKGAAASGGYPQLSQEYILNSDPDYVFLADTKCCKQTPESVAKRPGWPKMSAVQDGRIVALDDDIASRWGPRIVDLMKTVAQAIQEHPTA
jgi:iron complex transport system substrate-binding protein